ncbi:MAG: CRISPR system precrRNA processing endoribonuclease RAMP protein Cas6 [Candidatus Methanomethyliaceae archaeon]|nr:CRISPR system precrRNA processing endoribonuclease RAMP protein Cas6 [Candidatus Methanomethyliaceae archaeon]MDW7970513.1 CRISPR system precrRNA processing endoribonuclease RAMP protein Cas6 [Nitrososphaerota archaeon]
MSSINTLLIRFATEKPISFQSFSGFASCGVFYNLIKSIDESLAEDLHSSKRLAPWSASPIFLEYPPPPRIIYRNLPAPSIASISFTIMEDKLNNIIKEILIRPNFSIDLVDVKPRILNIGVETYDFSKIASSAEPLPMKFSIKFLTPTVFRRSIYDCCPYCPYYMDYLRTLKEGRKLERPCKYAKSCRGTILPLPLPSLMFKNMARIWAAFSDEKLDVWEAARWAEEAIVIAGFPKGIRTVRVYEHPTTNKWIVGFTGEVRFSIREDFYKDKYAKIASALIKMAEKTNVGVRRTAGLGMIKYKESNAKKDVST